MRVLVGDAIAAALAAAVLGGIPSTLWALATGADVLAATRAVGWMVLGRDASASAVLGAAAAVHGALSILFAALVVACLPRERPVVAAMALGLIIGLVNLRGIAPALFPTVAALPLAPQLADHLAWGAVVGWVAGRRRAARARRAARPATHP